jgi:hypothetical protein
MSLFIYVSFFQVDSLIQNLTSPSTRAVSFFFTHVPDLFADQPLTPLHLMTFNTEVTNEGQGYSNVTGLFTAPVSGVYAFFLNTAASPGYADTMQVID